MITARPGVTIEQLWQYYAGRRLVAAGGAGHQRPTLGGCLSMNIHGKNNYRAGTIGEHVLAFEALLPTGETGALHPASRRRSCSTA